MSASFDLSRFHAAQARDFARACTELRAGAKRTHWIWYIFPQLAALGRSPTARHYGIASLAEAHAYLADPVLAARLSEAASAALASGERDPHRLLGSPDDLKVRSSLTLFLAADPAQPALARLLDTLYGGKPDPATLSLLADPAADPR
ncbi:MAG: DUF1810 domain-containing protein [Acuticoccus sp.]